MKDSSNTPPKRANQKKTGSAFGTKLRTALRFIRPGDIFLFSLGDNSYGIGRIISRVSIGDIAEFFDIILDTPDISGVSVDKLKRLGMPLIIDSYCLFDRKLEGDWRIVARQENFIPQDVDHLFYTYGDMYMRKKVDVFDRIFDIGEEEASTLPLYSPKGDWQIKQALYPSFL